MTLALPTLPPFSPGRAGGARNKGRASSFMQAAGAIPWIPARPLPVVVAPSCREKEAALKEGNTLPHRVQTTQSGKTTRLHPSTEGAKRPPVFGGFPTLEIGSLIERLRVTTPRSVPGSSHYTGLVSLQWHQAAKLGIKVAGFIDAMATRNQGSIHPSLLRIPHGQSPAKGSQP